MINNDRFEGMNITHISSNLQNYEAARTGFFTLTVSAQDLGNLLSPNYTGDPSAATEADHLTGVQEALKLNVTKAPVPHFEISQVMEYRRGNDVVNYAGVPNFKDGSIVVDDVVGLGTKNLLYSWLYLVYNPITRKGGRMKDYKKRCTLLEYTQDYELIRIWTLEGCFPTDIQEGDFDKENDDRRQLTIPLKYDRATFKLPNEA